MSNELELIKSRIDKLNAFPQLPPKKEEDLQNLDVQIPEPQKVISRKEALDRPEQHFIIQKLKFQILLKEIEDYDEEIEKAGREGLVPKKVQVIPEKIPAYWAIRWVRPTSEEEKIFSPEEKRALTNYKEFGSSWMNNYLRTGSIIEQTPEKKDFFDSEIKLIDDAFGKAIPVEQKIEVYRGIKEIHLDNKEGSIFSDKAFVSTSLREYIAKRFGQGVVVKIIIPKGSKVIPLDFAIERSGRKLHAPAIEQRKEQEVLLPRDTKFKVIGKDDEGIMTIKALLNE